MNSKVYKYCSVPMCQNTTIKTPQKLFVHVPSAGKMRNKWFQLARRDNPPKSTNVYFCEDHFDMPNDMINFMQHSLMSSVKIQMKANCLPTKFYCQSGRKRPSSESNQPTSLKRQRKILIESNIKENLDILDIGKSSINIDGTTVKEKEEVMSQECDYIHNENSVPTDNDFDVDIGIEEQQFYKNKFLDLNDVTKGRLHCTACDKHLGCAPRNELRMRQHPMLRTLICNTCHTFYNSGEFEKGDDGSELYCRWCGQGGQVYCCSDCPHVFCAKCIKRNLGVSKIKEIESKDDWKCFKCNSNCLWDLRASCWALLKYCDIKNKLAYTTEDPDLKEKYQKDCALDNSQCCKDKKKRNSMQLRIKEEKKDVKAEKKEKADDVVAKIQPTIQVKKFASINNTTEKKAEKRKRSGSPSTKSGNSKSPAVINASLKNFHPIAPKKVKTVAMVNQQPILIHNPFKLTDIKKPATTRQPQKSKYSGSLPFNGRTFIPNDNINLSLESLTQGLDMAAVASMAAATAPNNDSVVCTPDFPLEPMCEVNEDNNDDDVQCMTPGPITLPKPAPPLLLKPHTAPPDLSPENIVQMTENDVTVNALTGGLKFRVDPQTLSSNKMYRLPDGRIFAINTNPNMPGGYSATIVAVSDTNAVGKTGKTFSAKFSEVTTPMTQSVLRKSPRKSYGNKKQKSPQKVAPTQRNDRPVDTTVPVEWYRFNVVDAVDALEYTLTRLKVLKQEATTMFLRTRSVEEMRTLHRRLERLLNTSASRFQEVRENLNRGLKEYLAKKSNKTEDDDDDDDDDVEILSNSGDDPIYIDENSDDGSGHDNTEEDVNLISDHNDSAEKAANTVKESDPKKDIESVNIVKDTIVQKLPECDGMESAERDPLLCPIDESNKTKNDSNQDDVREDSINVSNSGVNNDSNINDNDSVSESNLNNNFSVNESNTNDNFGVNEINANDNHCVVENNANGNEAAFNPCNINDNLTTDNVEANQSSNQNINMEDKIDIDDLKNSLLKETSMDFEDIIEKDSLDDKLAHNMQDPEISDALIDDLLKDDGPMEGTEDLQNVPLMESNSILSN